MRSVRFPAGPGSQFTFLAVLLIPKGVVLTQSQILENVYAIIERLELESGDGSCTWLPLSHDNGSRGMFLAALVGALLSQVAGR